jgi:hypothetical protein
MKRLVDGDLHREDLLATVACANGDQMWNAHGHLDTEASANHAVWVADFEADIDAISNSDVLCLMRQSFTASIRTALRKEGDGLDACKPLLAPFRERSEGFKYAISAGDWGMRRNQKPYAHLAPLALLGASVGGSGRGRDGRPPPFGGKIII